MPKKAIPLVHHVGLGHSATECEIALRGPVLDHGAGADDVDGTLVQWSTASRYNCRACYRAIKARRRAARERQGRSAIATAAAIALVLLPSVARASTGGPDPAHVGVAAFLVALTLLSAASARRWIASQVAHFILARGPQIERVRTWAGDVLDRELGIAPPVATPAAAPPAPPAAASAPEPPPTPPAPAAIPTERAKTLEALSHVVQGFQSARFLALTSPCACLLENLGATVLIEVVTEGRFIARPLTDEEWEALRARGVPLIPAAAARSLRCASGARGRS